MSRSAAPAHAHDHDHELAHGHDHEHAAGPIDLDREARTADAIWRIDNVELTTVGVDVGSATSHLMFSHLHLRRQAQGYSSRFVVVERRVLHRSDILLTPYRADGLIDADRLGAFIAGTYQDAGLARDDVDAGAVILTGVALERANSRRIAELFASEGGRFVCASAGHNLEALLAAHGSGSVAASGDGHGSVLNIDIGGGTTKFALCGAGQVVATMAIWGGSRLVVVDDDGRVERLEPPLAALADEIGVEVRIGELVDPETLDRLADGIAARIVAAAQGDGAIERLAGELPADRRPDRIVFSGGVAEYLDGDPDRVRGDLGASLARAVRARFAELGIPILAASERIRATVIGASQFTLQVSGNTIHLSDAMELPMHNIPVVAIDLDDRQLIDAEEVAITIGRRARQLDLAESDSPIAIAVSWAGEPSYAQLRALADGVAGAHRDSPRASSPVILVLEADVAASLGSILCDDVGVAVPIVAIDGIELSDLDYVDIGERILPANVVPVVIKSLVFPHAGAERPRILGSA